MNMEEITKRLKEPFPFKDTEWKIQVTNQEKTRGLAVVYIDSRAIQNRLDEVAGPFNWRNEYMLWQQEKSQICGISIFDETRGFWVTKYDGAENTDYEPVKGGLSDSFKRAAVIWGLGRYLYDIDAVWVEIEAKGKSYIISNSEKPRLENHYNKSVNYTAPVNAKQNKQESSPNANQTQHNQAAPSQQKRNQQPANTVSYDYKIQSAADSGNSMCLKLVNREGKEITAYVKKNSPGIKSGACIRNVQMDQKEAQFGTYYMLNEYEVAA